MAHVEQQFDIPPDIENIDGIKIIGIGPGYAARIFVGYQRGKPKLFCLCDERDLHLPAPNHPQDRLPFRHLLTRPP